MGSVHKARATGLLSTSYGAQQTEVRPGEGYRKSEWVKLFSCFQELLPYKGKKLILLISAQTRQSAGAADADLLHDFVCFRLAVAGKVL